MNKKKIRILVIVLTAAVVIGAAGFTLFVQPLLEQEEWEYKEHTAEYGFLQNGIVESGTVEFGISTQEYDLDISTEEDSDEDEEKYLKVEAVYVTVGQRIEKGEPVYKFTDDSVEEVRKSLTYSRTEAQIALLKAETEYNTGILTAGLSYDETKLAGVLAQEEYDNTMERLITDIQAKALEIQQALADILELQLGLVDEDYYDQKTDVLDAYEKAKEEVEEAREDFVTNRVEAASTFQTAKQSYEEFFTKLDDTSQQIQDKVDEVFALQQEIEYAQKLMAKEILSANQSYESADESDSIADTKYKSSLISYENLLKKAQKALEEAAGKLEAFEEFIGDGTVYAEGAGLITEVGYETGDSLISAGTLIAYAASGDMTITVDVSQEDVVALQVGDSVDIVFSAYEDEKYEGVIQSITTTATSQNSATVSYPVVISIQGDTSKLYGKMTADVTFVTERTEEVVYVSRKAIVEENGKKYVYQKAGNGYELVQVTTGFSDGVNVEITSGLEAGDAYYIASIAVKESKTDKEETKVGAEITAPTGEEQQNNMPQDGMKGGFLENMEGGRPES